MGEAKPGRRTATLRRQHEPRLLFLHCAVSAMREPVDPSHFNPSVCRKHHQTKMSLSFRDGALAPDLRCAIAHHLEIPGSPLRVAPERRDASMVVAGRGPF